MKNSIPLIHDGWRYYHSEITTSPFGGQTIETNHQRHNLKTKEIEKIDGWNKHMIAIMDDIGDEKFDNTTWDLDYYNPFVDYR